MHTVLNKTRELLSVLSMVIMGKNEQQQQQINMYRGKGSSVGLRHATTTTVDSDDRSKKWWKKDGFDLDLAYVTKRIIVHGVPNESSDPFYEDPRSEVRRLLDKYHHDRFKIYNFTSELVHMAPTEGGPGAETRTERYPFTDDTCPPLESVVDFCESAKAWLDAHEENVVSLHCKSGKGRAGIMAACLMVRMGESAHDAVASYDEIQGTDGKGRSGVNERAWVFLYERLIRQVWGLRDTIGTVSGQNPSLRAPPRVASCLRDVSLQLQIPNGRKRWRPILYHPSCVVYQQKSDGKTLVHRTKMSPVYLKRKDISLSVFGVTLPRTVIVEGTFQVVISAATGIFGLAKNVLDVWCNTTFLGENGGRETFKFTENDLPPGQLTERLLSANVSLVLTHTSPNAESPPRRRSYMDWEGRADSHEVGRDEASTVGRTLTLTMPTENFLNDPCTDGDMCSQDGSVTRSASSKDGGADADEGGGAMRGNEGDTAAENAPCTPDSDTSAIEDYDQADEEGVRRFYLSSDESSVAGSSDTPRGDTRIPLQLTVAENGGRPLSPGAVPWNLGLAGSAAKYYSYSYGLSTPTRSGFTTPAHNEFTTPARSRNGLTTPARSRSGFTTPLSGACRSPLRSCPRAAVSARKENLHERGERFDDEDTPERPASAPASPNDLPPPGGYGGVTPSCGERSSARLLLVVGGRSRVGTPLRDGERKSLLAAEPAPRDSDSASLGGNGSSSSSRRGDVGTNGVRSGRRDAAKALWKVALTSASADTEDEGSRKTVRLNELALRADASKESQTMVEKDNPFNDDGNDDDDGGGDGDRPRVTSAADASLQLLQRDLSPSRNKISKKSSSSSLGIQLLLATAAQRSFEDLQSSRHTSAADSETDQSEVVSMSLSRGGSFSDGDGERASLSARVLAGWVDSGIPPSSRQGGDLPVVTGLAERRLVTFGKSRDSSSAAAGPTTTKMVKSEELRLIPSLKTRCWPPPPCPPPVVAGPMEIQEVLTPRTDGRARGRRKDTTRPTRKYGSTGTSWGENAKLALARKRLQWEKSRGGAAGDSSHSLRMHASLVAKREAELLTIETDVKQAVRVLEERIARRESAQAALKKWRRELPPKTYEDVMGCLQGSQAFGLYDSS